MIIALSKSRVSRNFNLRPHIPFLNLRVEISDIVTGQPLSLMRLAVLLKKVFSCTFEALVLLLISCYVVMLVHDAKIPHRRLIISIEMLKFYFLQVLTKGLFGISRPKIDI